MKNNFCIYIGSEVNVPIVRRVPRNRRHSTGPSFVSSFSLCACWHLIYYSSYIPLDVSFFFLLLLSQSTQHTHTYSRNRHSLHSRRHALEIPTVIYLLSLVRSCAHLKKICFFFFVFSLCACPVPSIIYVYREMATTLSLQICYIFFFCNVDTRFQRDMTLLELRYMQLLQWCLDVVFFFFDFER